MDSSIYFITAIALVIVIIFFLYLRRDIDDDVNLEVREKILTEFIGVELYNTTIRELEKSFEEYRSLQSRSNENRIMELVRSALACQIVRRAEKEDIDHLIEYHQIFQLESLSDRIILTNYRKAILDYVLEGKSLTRQVFESHPFFFSLSVVLINREIIRLFQDLEMRELNRKITGD